MDTFYVTGLVYYIKKNIKRKKKSRIAHFSCKFVLLLVAAVGQIHFFAVLSFARMAKPICHAWPNCATFP